MMASRRVEARLWRCGERCANGSWPSSGWRWVAD